MTELGIIASVAQIADVGLRLSIKLYTFGEIVASADRSVISISKDVSLTSGVLKELGQILHKDRETGTFSETAVQTADGVVKECLEVFREMENIIVKKLPSLGAADEERGRGERVKRATVMLERLKWGYLQPKLELLQSNLDRLKSTLLLMLNVITYARQVAERTELPPVIAEQRCLIEELAHSNEEYSRKFERLRLNIEEPAGGPMDNVSRNGGVERESSNITKSMSGILNRKFKMPKSAFAGTLLQDKEMTRGLGSKEFNPVTGLSPKAPSSMTGSPTTLPNADTNNMFINTSVQSSLAMQPVQERGIPITEARVGSKQEVLFKQLEHHSLLIKNLLKEVDEAQYKITFLSRLRMKGGIVGLHEGERRDLEKLWGLTALQSAEQRLDSLMEGTGELPRVNRFAASDAFVKVSPYMANNIGTSRLFGEAPVEDDPNTWASHIDPMPQEIHTSSMSRPASIEPSSTYAGDETLRSDLSSYRQPVHQARPDPYAKVDSLDDNSPLPAPIFNRPSRAPTVKRPREALAAQFARSKRKGRTEVFAKKHRKSPTRSMRKGSGDRIGGYTEPHQQEDDTGEGGADMTTPSYTLAASASSLGASAGKQSELILKNLVSPPRLYAPVESVPAPRAYAPRGPALSQPGFGKGDSQLADKDLVDRLVSLWTTVKT